MAIESFRRLVLSALIGASSCLCAVAQGPAVIAPHAVPPVEHAELLPGSPAVVATDEVISYQLSLDEAISRTLQNSIIMDLASTQVAAKSYALQAAQKDYLPKLLNSFFYFHFDSDLGTVVTTPGIFNPATAISVPIVNQDAPLYAATAVQPITALLKVRAAVDIGEADVGAAQAQRQLARRELTKGVEQLYFGLFAARKIKGGLDLAAAGAQQLVAATNAPAGQDFIGRGAAKPGDGERPGRFAAGAAESTRESAALH